MVILVMYDHFHGIKLLFCPMEHKFPAVNKKCPQILLSKPVPLYLTQSFSLNTAGFFLASGFVTCPCVKVLSLNFTTTPCSSNLIELAPYNRPF